jgi:hypothetical protein
MSYANQYSVLNQSIKHSTLWRQAYVAVLNAANDIRNESGATNNHANRLAWALESEQDCNAKVNEMKIQVMANATISAAPNDAEDLDVQYVVNSLIDSFAAGG